MFICHMSIKLQGHGESNKKRILKIGHEMKKLEPVQIGTIIWATLYVVKRIVNGYEGVYLQATQPSHHASRKSW